MLVCGDGELRYSKALLVRMGKHAGRNKTELCNHVYLEYIFSFSFTSSWEDVVLYCCQKVAVTYLQAVFQPPLKNKIRQRTQYEPPVMGPTFKTLRVDGAQTGVTCKSTD